MFIDGEVGEAPAKLEQFLPWVPVPLVLLHCVFHRLLGQAVLQLEGGDGETVDEQPQVEREPGLVAAVAELPGHAESVLVVQEVGPLVPRRRGAIHQVNAMGPVADAVAEHLDGAALGDLTLKAG